MLPQRGRCHAVPDDEGCCVDQTPSPVLWDERKHGISGRDCTVSERYKDEWLDFGMAKFPFEMGQYLQSIGFKGLYSSIVEGKEFPFPI